MDFFNFNIFVLLSREFFILANHGDNYEDLLELKRREKVSHLGPSLFLNFLSRFSK